MTDNNPIQQQTARTDQDSPWKKALEKYFKEFLQLLFNDTHDKVAKLIDWEVDWQSLETCTTRNAV